MNGVNKVILLGALGKDPEMRYAASGSAICTFSVATSRSWKDKNGEKKTETEWHSVVCFDKLAEICGTYLKKGTKVFVEGRIKNEKWEKNGEIRNSFKIYAQEVQFLGETRSPVLGETRSPDETKQDMATDDVPF